LVGDGHLDVVGHGHDVAVDDVDVVGVVVRVPGDRVTELVQVEGGGPGHDHVVVNVHVRRGRVARVPGVFLAVDDGVAGRLPGQHGHLLVAENAHGADDQAEDQQEHERVNEGAFDHRGPGAFLSPQSHGNPPFGNQFGNLGATCIRTVRTMAV